MENSGTNTEQRTCRTARALKPGLYALALWLPACICSSTLHAQATSYPAMPMIPGQVCSDITAFGAVGDATTDNTTAIQSALDACSNSGGGTVTIPDGTFLSGPNSFNTRWLLTTRHRNPAMDVPTRYGGKAKVTWPFGRNTGPTSTTGTC